MSGIRQDGATRRSGPEQGSLGRLAFAILALFSILAISFRLGPGWGLLVFVLGMALLGVGAWLWGADSRESRNWK